MQNLHRLLAGCALACAQVQADELFVTTTLDRFDGVCDADCSLREAVAYASAQPGTHRIKLAPGTYSLSIAPARDEKGIVEENASLNGDLDVSSDLTIVGAGIGRTLIDGNFLDRLFDVQPGGRLSLERLTLRKGETTGDGGALRNQGEALLDAVNLEGNRVLGEAPAAGGAIANLGTLSLKNSTLHDNLAFSLTLGSGQGGALYNLGHLRIRDTTMEGNGSSDVADTGRGGALYNQGSADIARSAFIGNLLGGYGDGAAILNAEGGVLSLSNSTLSQNRPQYGRGAFANGQSGSPGNTFTQALLVNVSIVDNGNYGLANYATLTVRNSLIAANRYLPDEGEPRPHNCLNQSDRYQARGLLLGEDGGACNADLRVDDALAFTQILGPLANNGGPTRTHALLANSPALDRGVDNCTLHDQRGTPRMQDGNGDGVAGCDLGAFERDATY
ncbi:CSLREA domain-containing protein [Pseudomonas sp. RIT-PI-AD]|uniref:CSLREA domain-containing protein n=1 Tax=Pseudomonas sp. RIT-PI-AD TaxID=3035294 RepID=UPI0021D7FE42|nr:CSLREA domain-containing protein [Pseudomonas sp. RIT-PI-AD]